MGRRGAKIERWKQSAKELATPRRASWEPSRIASRQFEWGDKSSEREEGRGQKCKEIHYCESFKLLGGCSPRDITITKRLGVLS